MELTPILSRRERNKLQAREKIIHAALNLFDKKGIDETGIAEIMKAADLGTGTFYNYFPSKEAIVETFINDKVSAAKREIECLLTYPGSTIEKLSSTLTIVIKTFEENNILSKFFIQLQRTNPGVSPGNHGPVFKGLLYDIITSGQRSGEITASIPPTVILEGIHGLLWSVLSSNNTDLTLTANLQHKLTLLFQGIQK